MEPSRGVGTGSLLYNENIIQIRLIAQGAGLGALSGLIGALVGVVVLALTSSLSMPLFERLARLFQIEGDLPFQAGGAGAVIIQALIFLVINAVVYPIFGALSGLIAASLFWKKPQA